MIKGIIKFAKALVLEYDMTDDLIEELLAHINGLDLTYHDSYALEHVIFTLQDEVDEEDVATFVKKFCEQTKDLKMVYYSSEDDEATMSAKAKKLMV